MKKAKRLAAIMFAATMALGTTAFNVHAEESGEPITITFWHSLGAETSGEVINEFIPMYEAEHPNIKIDMQSFQSDDYQTRQLKVAVSDGSQADVFHSYAAGYSQPFVDAGACLPLDDYFDADKTWDRLQDGVLEYMTYDGTVYGIPLTRWAGVLFCNTDLFEQYQVEYPETWDQLLEAVKVFRENGIVPMCVGAKEGWHACMYQNAFAMRTAGAEYCNKALVGEETLNTPEIVQSAQMMIDLKDAGAFDEGVLGLSSDEANMEFMMGNIPMYFSGSWSAAQVVSEDNQVAGKIKVMPLPTVEGGKGNTDFLGGATACYMINSKCEHPDEAVAFATALAEYQADKCYLLGDDITCWKYDVDESEVNPVLMEINKLSENSTGYVLAWDTFLVGSAIDKHYTLVQELLGGACTAEEFAEKTQAANVEALNLEK
ncbi:extracellular solute-binding protein [Blautia schinkii]|nr:extracellular solute-binding protein [Blautia schinkii]